MKFSSLALAGATASLALASASKEEQDISLAKSARDHAHDNRPNILFIITDDQDLHLDSLNYMPKLKKNIIDQGTYYSRHYCTIAICCPSRVSLLTGMAAHNTNVTDVAPPYGKPDVSAA